MPEVYPSTAEPRDERVAASYQPGEGEHITTTISGTAADIEALYGLAKVSASNPPSRVTSLTFEKRNGRGTISQVEARVLGGWWGSVEGRTGKQELLAIDVIRPIWAAPYWDLGYVQLGEVRRAYEDGVLEVDGDWDLKQKQLFGHLVNGYESYYETAYVFRRTFNASSGRLLAANTSVVNQVAPLPSLSPTLTRLIDALPTGEWLKRPTSVRNLERNGWEVSEEYLWAPKWSVVYGGTFTGGFA